MNDVRLRKNGILNHNGRDVKKDPLMLLGCPVALDGDVLLRSYFQMLDIYPVFTRLGPFIPDCAAQYKTLAGKDCRTTPAIDHLELGKTIEMIGYPGEPKMEQYTTLTGIDKTSPVDMASFGLESLLDVPLRLGKLKHIVFGDKCDMFHFKTIFTLFEFIDGISWELSFHNTPKQCRI